MPTDNTTTTAGKARDRAGRLFTVESANHALVFVRRIVQDVVDHYGNLMRLRRSRDELAAQANIKEERLDAVRTQMEREADTLNRLNDELAEVGCELKDWKTGLIDFPAIHDGRKVCLCWRLGEAGVAHWHELEAGFAGRRPIEADFESPQR